MIGIIAFVAGSMIGSFLNVCIYRLPRDESIVKPARSYCPKCHATIRWYDNVPVLSYLVLKGRCRRCGWRIPARYVVVELLAASLTAFTVVRFAEEGGWALTVVYVALVNTLIAVTFIDLEHLIIPNEISIPGMFLGIAVSALLPSLQAGGIFCLGGRAGSLASSVLGAVAGGGIIYFVGVAGKLVLKKEAMGGGDVKLMAMVGAFIGWRLVLLSIFLGSLFGSIIGVMFLAMRKADMQTRIPFGPYLALGSLVSLFYGNALFAWYTGLLCIAM
ncbi:MAG: prepilin peptidase [Candidatus Tritonobacter lacicola]|nr:prepilin peptidase [Candidatus Tritonobacter lacicola]